MPHAVENLRKVNDVVQKLTLVFLNDDSAVEDMFLLLHPALLPHGSSALLCNRLRIMRSITLMGRLMRMTVLDVAHLKKRVGVDLILHQIFGSLLFLPVKHCAAIASGVSSPPFLSSSKGTAFKPRTSCVFCVFRIDGLSSFVYGLGSF
ncbi:hypothetical protein DPMN_047732 [Dreissena polymorpha]|uniref:Uncharacterized protein n=1 Tax=Dreissena polymorpha TaxID=45954 RepID=A0A9D4DA93_DREPO|nr:hypothetical protein DPMN_047732 [Dreissena polymorpha]